MARTRWFRAAAVKAFWSAVLEIVRADEGDEGTVGKAVLQVDLCGLQARSEAARASML